MYGIKSNHFIHHHTHGLRGGVLHLEVLIWCGGSEPGQSIDHECWKIWKGSWNSHVKIEIHMHWLKYIYFFYDLFSWPKTHGDSNIARRTIRLQGHQLPSCHLQMQASFNIFFSWIIHKKKREKSLNHVVCLGHAKPWPKKKLYVAKALYNIRPQRAGLPHAAMASELAATTNNKMNMSQCHYSWRRP